MADRGGIGPGQYTWASPTKRRAKADGRGGIHGTEEEYKGAQRVIDERDKQGLNAELRDQELLQRPSYQEDSAALQHGVEGWTPFSGTVATIDPIELKNIEDQLGGQMDNTLKNLTFAHYAVFGIYPDFDLTADILAQGEVEFETMEEAVAFFEMVRDSYAGTGRSWQLEATGQVSPGVFAANFAGERIEHKGEWSEETDVLDPEMIASFRPEKVEDFLFGPYMKRSIEGKSKTFRNNALRLDAMLTLLPRQWAISNLGESVGRFGRKNNPDLDDDEALMKELNEYLIDRVPDASIRPAATAAWQENTEKSLKFLQMMRASAIYIAAGEAGEARGEDAVQAAAFLKNQGFGDNVIENLNEQIALLTTPYGSTTEEQRKRLDVNAAMVQQMWVMSRNPGVSERQALFELADRNPYAVTTETRTQFGIAEHETFFGQLGGWLDPVVPDAVGDVAGDLVAQTKKLFDNKAFKAVRHVVPALVGQIDDVLENTPTSPWALGPGKNKELAWGLLQPNVKAQAIKSFELMGKFYENRNELLITSVQAVDDTLTEAGVPRELSSLFTNPLDSVLARPLLLGIGERLGWVDMTEYQKSVWNRKQQFAEYIAIQTKNDPEGIEQLGQFTNRWAYYWDNNQDAKDAGIAMQYTDELMRSCGVDPADQPVLSFVLGFAYDTALDLAMFRGAGMGFKALKATSYFKNAADLVGSHLDVATKGSVTDNLFKGSKIVKTATGPGGEKVGSLIFDRNTFVTRLNTLFGVGADDAKGLAGRLEMGLLKDGSKAKTTRQIIDESIPDWSKTGVKSSTAKAAPNDWANWARLREIMLYDQTSPLYRMKHPFVTGFLEKSYHLRKASVADQELEQSAQGLASKVRTTWGKSPRGLEIATQRLIEEATLTKSTDDLFILLDIAKSKDVNRLADWIAGRYMRTQDDIIDQLERGFEVNRTLHLAATKGTRSYFRRRALKDAVFEPDMEHIGTQATRNRSHLYDLLDDVNTDLLHYTPASKAYTKWLWKKHPDSAFLWEQHTLKMGLEDENGKLIKHIPKEAERRHYENKQMAPGDRVPEGIKTQEKVLEQSVIDQMQVTKNRNPHALMTLSQEVTKDAKTGAVERVEQRELSKAFDYDQLAELKRTEEQYLAQMDQARVDAGLLTHKEMQLADANLEQLFTEQMYAAKYAREAGEDILAYEERIATMAFLHTKNKALLRERKWAEKSISKPDPLPRRAKKKQRDEYKARVAEREALIDKLVDQEAYRYDVIKQELDEARINLDKVRARRPSEGPSDPRHHQQRPAKFGESEIDTHQQFNERGMPRGGRIASEGEIKTQESARYWEEKLAERRAERMRLAAEFPRRQPTGLPVTRPQLQEWITSAEQEVDDATRSLSLQLDTFAALEARGTFATGVSSGTDPNALAAFMATVPNEEVIDEKALAFIQSEELGETVAEVVDPRLVQVRKRIHDLKVTGGTPDVFAENLLNNFDGVFAGLGADETALESLRMTVAARLNRVRQAEASAAMARKQATRELLFDYDHPGRGLTPNLVVSEQPITTRGAATRGITFRKYGTAEGIDPRLELPDDVRRRVMKALSQNRFDENGDVFVIEVERAESEARDVITDYLESRILHRLGEAKEDTNWSFVQELKDKPLDPDAEWPWREVNGKAPDGSDVPLWTKEQRDRGMYNYTNSANRVNVHAADYEGAPEVLEASAEMGEQADEAVAFTEGLSIREATGAPVFVGELADDEFMQAVYELMDLIWDSHINGDSFKVTIPGRARQVKTQVTSWKSIEQWASDPDATRIFQMSKPRSTATDTEKLILALDKDGKIIVTHGTTGKAAVRKPVVMSTEDVNHPLHNPIHVEKQTVKIGGKKKVRYRLVDENGEPVTVKAAPHEVTGRQLTEKEREKLSKWALKAAERIKVVDEQLKPHVLKDKATRAALGPTKIREADSKLATLKQKRARLIKARAKLLEELRRDTAVKEAKRVTGKGNFADVPISEHLTLKEAKALRDKLYYRHLVQKGNKDASALIKNTRKGKGALIIDGESKGVLYQYLRRFENAGRREFDADINYDTGDLGYAGGAKGAETVARDVDLFQNVWGKALMGFVETHIGLRAPINTVGAGERRAARLAEMAAARGERPVAAATKPTGKPIKVYSSEPGVGGQLSNFATSPVTLGKYTFRSVEHAYQTAKVQTILGREAAQEFATKAAKMSPAQAKKEADRITKGVKGAGATTWHETNLDIMRRLLRKKFEDPKMREALLSTGNRPLEHVGAYTDKFWGMGKAGAGGENWHGKLLMEIREELRPKQAKSKPTGAGSFEIVEGAGDFKGMRGPAGKHINNTKPGEPGALGNPYKATDAGGTYSREEATALFEKDFLARVDSDPEFRDWVLSLRGKKIGYYKPDEETIHLQAVQRWLEKQVDETGGGRPREGDFGPRARQHHEARPVNPEFGGTERGAHERFGAATGGGRRPPTQDEANRLFSNEMPDHEMHKVHDSLETPKEKALRQKLENLEAEEAWYAGKAEDARQNEILWQRQMALAQRKYDNARAKLRGGKYRPLTEGEDAEWDRLYELICTDRAVPPLEAGDRVSQFLDDAKTALDRIEHDPEGFRSSFVAESSDAYGLQLATEASAEWQTKQWHYSRYNYSKLSKFLAGGPMKSMEAWNANKRWIGLNRWSIDDFTTFYKTLVMMKVSTMLRIPLADEATRFITQGINPLVAWKEAKLLKELDKMPRDIQFKISRLLKAESDGTYTFIEYGSRGSFVHYKDMIAKSRRDPTFARFLLGKRLLDPRSARAKEAHLGRERMAREIAECLNGTDPTEKNLRELVGHYYEAGRNLGKGPQADALFFKAWYALGYRKGGGLRKTGLATHRFVTMDDGLQPSLQKDLSVSYGTSEEVPPEVVKSVAKPRAKSRGGVKGDAQGLIDADFQNYSYWYDHPTLGGHFRPENGWVASVEQEGWAETLERGMVPKEMKFGQAKNDDWKRLRDLRVGQRLKRHDGTFTEPMTDEDILRWRPTISGQRTFSGTKPTIVHDFRDWVYGILDYSGSKMNEMVYAHAFRENVDLLTMQTKARLGRELVEEEIIQLEKTAHYTAKNYMEKVMFTNVTYGGEDFLRNLVMFLPAYRQFATYWGPYLAKHPFALSVVYRMNRDKEKMKVNMGPFEFNMGRMSFLINQGDTEENPANWVTGFLPSGAPVVTVPVSIGAHFTQNDKESVWGELAGSWPFEFAGQNTALHSPLDKLSYGILGYALPWPLGSGDEMQDWRIIQMQRNAMLKDGTLLSEGDAKWKNRMNRLMEGGWNFFSPVGVRINDEDLDAMATGKQEYNKATTPEEIAKVLAKPEMKIFKTFLHWENLPDYEKLDYITQHPEIIPYAASGYAVQQSATGNRGVLYSRLQDYGIPDPSLYVERMEKMASSLENVVLAEDLRGQKEKEETWWYQYKADHAGDHEIERLQEEWENSSGEFAAGGRFFQQGWRGTKYLNDKLSTQWNGISSQWTGITYQMGADAIDQNDSYRFAKFLDQMGGASRARLQMSSNYEMYVLAKHQERQDKVQTMLKDYIKRRVTTRFTESQIRDAGFSEPDAKQLYSTVKTIDNLWNTADTLADGAGGYPTSKGRFIRKTAIEAQNRIIHSSALNERFFGDNIASLYDQTYLTKPAYERDDFVRLDKLSEPEREMYKHLTTELDPETGEPRLMDAYLPGGEDDLIENATILGYVPVTKNGRTTWLAKIRIGDAGERGGTGGTGIIGTIAVKAPTEAKTIKLDWKKTHKIFSDMVAGSDSLTAVIEWRKQIDNSNLPDWARTLVEEDMRAEAWKVWLSAAETARSELRESINVEYGYSPGYSPDSPFGQRWKQTLLDYGDMLAKYSPAFSAEWETYNGDNEMVNSIIDWYL